MRTLYRWLPPLLMVGILVFALDNRFWAGDEPNKAKNGEDMKGAHDKALYDVLRVVINNGADLFNLNRDYSGCYRLYQGALITVRPALEHHPDLQKAIDKGLQDAERQAFMTDRAFALRKVIDDIRARVNPKKGGGDGGTDDKKKDDKTTGKKDTLWDRLGGEAGVSKVVDDFVAAAAPDPKVNFFRKGIPGAEVDPKELDVKALKKQTVAIISQHTGGPLKYTGKSMKEIHKGMQISNEEFNAAAGHLKKALEDNKVAPGDITKVMDLVGSTRKDIVEPKQGDGKKDDGKKDDGKKDDGKKDDKGTKDAKDGKADGKTDKANKDAPEVDGRRTEVKQDGETATVTGKVQYKGQPLTAGTVLFVSKDNKGSGKIEADGTYSVKDLPAGEYRVAITAKDAALPAAYSDPEKSVLTFTAKKGSNNFNIELK